MLSLCEHMCPGRARHPNNIGGRWPKESLLRINWFSLKSLAVYLSVLAMLYMNCCHLPHIRAMLVSFRSCELPGLWPEDLRPFSLARSPSESASNHLYATSHGDFRATDHFGVSKLPCLNLCETLLLWSLAPAGLTLKDWPRSWKH